MPALATRMGTENESNAAQAAAPTQPATAVGAFPKGNPNLTSLLPSEDMPDSFAQGAVPKSPDWRPLFPVNLEASPTTAPANTVKVSPPAPVFVLPTTSLGGGFIWKGVWAPAAPYPVNSVVLFNSSAYLALTASSGAQPDLNPTKWQLISENLVFNPSVPRITGTGFSTFDKSAQLTGGVTPQTAGPLTPASANGWAILANVNASALGSQATPQFTDIFLDQCRISVSPLQAIAPVFVSNTVTATAHWATNLLLFGGVSYPLVRTISSVAVNGSNVATVQCVQSFIVGTQVSFLNVVNATFLNGQTVTITAATPTSFTFAFTHAVYAATADAGTATNLPYLQSVAVDGPALPSALTFPNAVKKGSTILVAVMSSDVNANWAFNTIGDNQSNAYTIKNSGAVTFGFASLAYAQGVKAGSTTVTMNVTAVSGTVSMRYAIFELPGSPVTPQYQPFDVLEFRGSMFVCVAETNVDPFTSMTGWVLLAQGTGGADALTGAYTALPSDYGRLKTNSTGGSITVKLPATPPLNPDGTATWWMSVQATVSAIVVNPNGLNLDTSASNLTVPAGQGLLIFTDGVNYFSMRGLQSLVLQINGTPNGSQTLLNLVAGADITLTDNGSGSITIAASAAGAGNATQIQSVNISATAPLNGQVLRYVAPNTDWEPSNDEAYIPTQRWMSTIMANGVNTTLGVLGDLIVAASGTLGAFGPQNSPRQANALIKASGVSGTNYGFAGSPNYRGDHNFAALLIGDLQDGSIVSQRTWAGLTDQTLATMLGSANPAGNYAAFRFDTGASDTVYQCITKDGTTQTITSSGVTPVSGPALRFAIVYDNANSKVRFYINSVLVATNSTHLPTNTANMSFVFCGLASAGTGSLTLEKVSVQQDF